MRAETARARRQASLRSVAVFVAITLVSGACSSAIDGELTAKPQITVHSPLPCDVVGCVGEGIDTATGAYTLSTDDLLFPPGLFAVEVSRHYRSDRTTDGWFGRGWATIYETTLVSDADGWTLDAPAGLSPLWSPEAPEGWSVVGSPSVVPNGAGGAQLLWPSGEKWVFGEDGSLQVISAPYGQTVRIERDGSTPIAVRSSQGVSLEFTSEDGRIVSVQSEHRRVTYGYVDGLVGTVSAPGLDVKYTYNTDGLIVEHASPSGTTTTDYTAGLATNQVTSSGQRFSLVYEGRSATVRSETTETYEHDLEGRLTRVVNQDGELLARRYDDAGRLIESIDFVQPGSGVLQSVRREYEADRLRSETINDQTFEFEYDSHGRVVDVRDGIGSTLFEYDGNAPLPTAVVSRLRGRDELTYVDGFLTRVVDATGVPSTTGRDSIGNPITHAVGERAAWAYEFDPEGNVTSTTAPSGRRWSATWGPRSRLVEERDPLGRVSSYRHDGAGRLVEQHLPGIGVTTVQYDDFGRLEQETSTDGSLTRYEYDTRGRLSTMVLPGGRVWRFATQRSDTGASTLTVTGPDGVSTVSTFDSAGREIERRSIAADGSIDEVTTHAYRFELLTKTTVERGRSRFESSTTHDPAGRVTSITESLDGREVGHVTFEFDQRAMIRASNDRESASYEYDPAGRLVKVQSETDLWEASFLAGQLVATRHNDEVTEIDYDVDGRATTFTDENSTTTRWTLDDVDRPTARVVGAATATFVWSDADRLVGYRAPDGGKWNWTFDSDGRLLEASEPGEVITSYEYVLGSTTRITTVGPDHDREDTFEYDARGLLTSADTDAGSFEYRYDATGKPSELSGDVEEQWAYDAMGRVVTVQADDDTFDLAYDDDGRLDRIVGPETFLQVSWNPAGLTAIEASDRDVIRLADDPEERLVTVKWDDDTAVDLDWSADGSTLRISSRGSDEVQSYQFDNGTLRRYVGSDGLELTSTLQDNGYLKSLRLEKDDVRGEVTFDSIGRPAIFSAAETSSTIAYDDRGRVASVVTSRTGNSVEETRVTYGDEGREVEGDDQIVDALFSNDGGLRTPLPSSLANPISAAIDDRQLAATSATFGSDLLVAPEPRPFEDVERAIARSTPSVVAPIGVDDLPHVAEQMVVAEIARRAPTVRVNGDLSVRIPVIDPTDGTLADFNPFVDAAPSGLVLGILTDEAGGGDSLLERARNSIADIVGGALSLAAEVVEFAISNPIARFVVSAGAWGAATIACGAFLSVCVPAAAAAVLLAVADSGQAIVTSTLDSARSCAGGRLTQCGLLVAGTALAVTALAASARVGFALARTVRAQRVFASAIDSGAGAALASGKVGTAKSELLAALRWEGVVGRERPVCAGNTCARLDLVTRTITGRHRFVEVKNGAGARLTMNQRAVYPVFQTSGAYFPIGIRSGGSPQLIIARSVEVQHWGADIPIAIP